MSDVFLSYASEDRERAADLVGWQGDEGHPGFQGLCQGVAHAMGSEAPAPRPPPASTAPLCA